MSAPQTPTQQPPPMGNYPPPPPGYGPTPGASWSPPPPAQPVSHTGRNVAIVASVIVVVVIVLAGLAYLASQAASSNSGTGGSQPHVVVTPHSQQIDQTSNQPFGPGMSNAGVFAFTIPPSATAAWVNGSFTVSQCTSIGNYCLAYVMIMTPTAYQNWAGGGTVSTLWCYTAGTGSCQQEQTVSIATGNISAQAGQALDLVMVSGATTLSQAYTCDVSLYWNTAATVG